MQYTCYSIRCMFFHYLGYTKIFRLPIFNSGIIRNCIKIQTSKLSVFWLKENWIFTVVLVRNEEFIRHRDCTKFESFNFLKIKV